MFLNLNIASWSNCFVIRGKPEITKLLFSLEKITFLAQQERRTAVPPVERPVEDNARWAEYKTSWFQLSFTHLTVVLQPKLGSALRPGLISKKQEEEEPETLKSS